MTLEEIEIKTGMEQANIMFYESEGLITSMQLGADERYYSEESLQILLRIKLLRSLHISLDEIKVLRYGNQILVETLSNQIDILKSEAHDVSYAIKVCELLMNDQVTFDELEGQKYLDLMEQIREKAEIVDSGVDEDKLDQVFHPWRRYFARMLDIFIYSSIWSAVLIFLFHVSMIRRGSLWDIFDTFIAVGMMLFIEPLLLNKFGTTPGKALFGLRIETSSGEKLSYMEGLDRTWHVIGVGMGYNIPIYSLVRLWKSYKLCRDESIQPWDEYCAYSIKDTKWYRGLSYIVANIVLVGLVIVMMVSQLLPPNRGDLSISEFTENYNYYAHYFGIDFGNKFLDKNGEWVEEASDNTITFDFGYLEMPQYVFTLEKDVVKAVSFNVVVEEPEKFLSSYDVHMLLASIAFAGAQDEMKLFSELQERIANQISDHTFEDFHFTEAGIKFDCDIEYTGYEDTSSHLLVLKDYATSPYFSINFSMRQVD